ncbi:hypothetical protein ACIP23_29960, partial [Streptomyces sp. NPDC089733]
MTPEGHGERDRALDAMGVRHASGICPGTVHGFTMADTDAVDLGPVFELPSAVRRPVRTLAALSGSPRYIQHRGGPPPCDRTHRTPH